MSETNGHTTLADRLNRQFKISTDRITEQNKPAPDRFPRTRAAISLLSAFQKNSLHRNMFLKAEGIDPSLVDTDFISKFCQSMLGNADFDEDKAFRHFEHSYSSDRPYGLLTRRMSEVDDESMEWIWEQRIPLGDITLLSGDPGVGKTWIALYIAARLTMGQPFFDAPAPFKERHDILFMSLEDRDARIKARLRDLGADLTRIHTGTELKMMVTDPKSKKKEDVHTIWDLERGLASLENKFIAHPQIALVIIDPLLAFLGGKESNSYTQVKQLLSPLVKLIQKYKVSVIGLNHLNKSGGTKAQYRSMGSIAFNGTARANWDVLRDDDNKKAGFFCLGKCNDRTCDDDQYGNRAFHLELGKGLIWDKPVTSSADEILQESSGHNGRCEEATEWIKEHMEPGKDYLGLQEKMVEDGFTKNTIQRARKSMGVETTKTKEGWVWCWQPLTPQ